MKKSCLAIIAVLLCVLLLPMKTTNAEGNQLKILTSIFENENVVKTFDQTVDNDSSTIPGLTISYESDDSGDFFVINVNDGATVDLNGFLTDEVESFIGVSNDNCGIKITGKGTLNLTAKTNPNGNDRSFKYFLNSNYKDMYIGNENGGPTINIKADVDDNDLIPYDGFYGFVGRCFFLKNTTINVGVCCFLFNGIVDLSSIPVAEREILTLDNTTINFDFHRLNSHDTNNEKEMSLIMLDDPTSFGNVNIKNKSKITVKCDDSDMAGTDLSFIGQNSVANLNIDNSSIEINIKNPMVIAQPRSSENGCGGINITGGSTFTVHSDSNNGNGAIMIAENINVENSTLNIETKISPFRMSGNSVTFKDSNINIDIDSTDPLPIFVGFNGEEDALPDDLIINIIKNGETQTWTKDNMNEFPKGKLEIKTNEPNQEHSSKHTHVVLNTSVN